MLEFQTTEEFQDHSEEQEQKRSKRPPIQIVYRRRGAMAKGIISLS